MSPVNPVALAETVEPADASPPTRSASDGSDSGIVAQWLLDNPEFFETHADLLAEVRLQHGGRGKTISLIERQVAVLRERNQALEGRLDDLIRIGQDNDALGARLQPLLCDLLRCADPLQLPTVLADGLRGIFAVPQVVVRLWRDGPHDDQGEPVSAELRRKIDELSEPYCGPSVFSEAASWLTDDGVETRSVVLIALRAAAEAPAWGVVVLGSPDAGRFQAGMGTAFLGRLAELAGASLSRLQPGHD